LWQIERFVEPYKIKKIVSSNAVELELSSTVKIHLVVNVSRIQRYIKQYYETVSRKETISYIFLNLVNNI